MTYHVAIEVQGEPYDIGLDEKGWARASFTVLGWKRSSATPWLDDLRTLIEAALVADERTSLFMSSAALLPAPSSSAPQSFLVLTATPGAPPVGTHNAGAGAYRRPGARITAYGRTWPLAFELAQDALAALVDVRNQTVASA